MNRNNVKDTNKQKIMPYYFFFPFLFVIIIWLVFWVENTLQLNFTRYGILPMKFSGLRGIFFSPFIHSDIKHLFNNSLPLFITGSFLFFHYRRIAWKVLFIGWMATGILTWILGRHSYHIGISGINYMLISFLFFSGVFIGYYRLIAVSLIIVFLYGSLIWLMFPIVEHISWEGHLSGFVSGLFLAFIFSKKLKKDYDNKKIIKINPEEKDFLSHFDENGNFREKITENKEKTISNKQ